MTMRCEFCPKEAFTLRNIPMKDDIWEIALCLRCDSEYIDSLYKFNNDFINTFTLNKALNDTK